MHYPFTLERHRPCKNRRASIVGISSLLCLLFLQAAKEKALQLERKRKAASFLALLAEKKTTVR